MNHAILMTPAGTGAIAVVRLAGQGAEAFLSEHFSRPVARGGRHLGILRDGAREIDECLAVVGADGGFVELHLHGGAWIAQAAMELAGREGFSPFNAQGKPIPTTLADGSTTLEREIEAHLPLARGEMAVRALLAQHGAWERARQGGGIDIESTLADRSMHFLLKAPTIAIVGQSNAGKSTLANLLFGQERSITADLPGTTRDWVGQNAMIEGLWTVLIDTPGVRREADPIERAAIGHSARQIEKADLALLVVDATAAIPPQLDLAGSRPHLVALNKMDRAASGLDLSAAGEEVVPIIATRGTGVELLRMKIAAWFGVDRFDASRARIWTERHRRILQRTRVEPAALLEI